jgi:hypothetical protein
LPSGSRTTHCWHDLFTERAITRFLAVLMLYSSGAWSSRANAILL